MVKINDIEYSGYVTEGDNEITVIISTIDTIQDVISKMTSVKEIEEKGMNGIDKTYVVTNPISAAVVSRNVYAIRFSTKPTPTQQLEEKTQEMSDVIDELLVMMLEG